MPSILNEYLKKKLGILELQQELLTLIGSYNNYTGRYMFIYAADFNKATVRGVDVSLIQEDFYIIQDILRQSRKKEIDFYIETPGGSGEAAEEIARFLRNKFEVVNFVIAGEAKSAGTILVLSGDNIYMTDTGSLGPIDAQIKIGRSVISAHDYKAWVDEKKMEAEKTGKLNPFDAVMIAQISPGELYGVINSLEFAKDLVKGWLEKYKFKNWIKTNDRSKSVTAEMKKERASEVAEMLCNHTTWRTHGRSLKISDLSEVLLIESIDKDKQLADIVYRIKTVTRLIFDSSTIYKLYYHENFRLAKTFSVNQSNTPVQPPSSPAQKKNLMVEVAEFELNCPKCKKTHKIPGFIDIPSSEIKNRKLKFNHNVKDNDIFICDNCGFAIDLKPIKSQFETQTNRKITFK